MKRTVPFVIMFLFCLAACSVEENGSLREAVLNISRDEVRLDADAGLEILVVESDMDWSIEDIPQWCGTVKPSYGSAGRYEVRIRGRFYEERTDRSAEVKVVSGSSIRKFTLIQTGARKIMVETDVDKVTSAGGQVRLTVNSDFEYQMVIPQECTWLTRVSEETPLQGDIVVSVAPNEGKTDRRAVLRFCQTDGDYVKEITIFQTCALSENRYYDKDVKRLQTATKGRGVNVVIMGDGFVASDLEYGGEFDRMVDVAYKAIFSFEPMASYKEYFNVYVVATESAVSGIGRVTAKNTPLKTFFRSEEPSNLTMNLDDSAVYAYMEKTGLTDRVNTAVLIIANTDDVGGTNISWPDGRCIAICTKTGPNHNGVEGVICHELVGHAIGRLDEEYTYISGPVTQEYKDQLAERHAKGWSLNIDTTDDPTKVAWKHFIGLPGYENVGCFNFKAGVVFSGGGVCESENHMGQGAKVNCMVDNSPYFNAPSREQIVKHILEIAGEEYSFEDFIANDKLRGPVN